MYCQWIAKPVNVKFSPLNKISEPMICFGVRCQLEIKTDVWKERKISTVKLHVKIIYVRLEQKQTKANLSHFFYVPCPFMTCAIMSLHSFLSLVTLTDMCSLIIPHTSCSADVCKCPLGCLHDVWYALWVSNSLTPFSHNVSKNYQLSFWFSVQGSFCCHFP